MKSCMVREIFRDELYHLYDEKTQIREKLVEKSKERIRELKKDFSVKSNTEINTLFQKLADEMRTYKGKKVYSYSGKYIANHLFIRFSIAIISLFIRILFSFIIRSSAYISSGMYGIKYLPSITSLAITFGSFLSFLLG